MNFIEFLIETAKQATVPKQSNSAMLIMQKIIDMVDHGHVDYTKTKIFLNVGKLIKDSNLYKLDIVIRQGEDHVIRLAKSTTSDNMVIVIDVARLPARHKLESFFEKNNVVEKFIPVLQKYLKDHHIPVSDVVPVTSYEKGKLVNDKKTFESKYTELAVKIKEQIADYQQSKNDIDRQIEVSSTPAKREVLKLSLEHNKKEFLGSNVKEFISKMLKLADADFIAHLDATSKAKLISRLSNFYEHNN